MNCNDSMTFLRERRRMCKTYYKNCRECPACSCRCALDTTLDSEADYKNTLEVVQKWSDEHPLKTYKQDFLEKFPNAPFNEYDDKPVSCRQYIYGGSCQNVGGCFTCTDCWNAPMKEET